MIYGRKVLSSHNRSDNFCEFVDFSKKIISQIIDRIHQKLNLACNAAFE